MESRGNFDYQSDLDFPSLGSNVVNGDSKRNSPPPQQPKESIYRDSRDNSRSMSRGRGKKQNWKTVQVEFNNNSHGPRFQPRGAGRARFGNNHAISRPTEEQPLDMGYRSYRSRNRRARGGFAPHNFGQPQSTEPSPEHKPEQLSIMAIPYTPNYATYVQPLAATVPTAEPPQVDIKEVIRRQIEYYFSDENLIKDSYMRTNMTKEGFLSIKLIANFNKIRQMNVDIETITQAIEASDKLDVVDREIVRPVINPLRWPLSQPLPDFPSLVKNYLPYDPLLTMSSIFPLVKNLNSVEPLAENIQPGITEHPIAAPHLPIAAPQHPHLPIAAPQHPHLPTAAPQVVYPDVEPASPDPVDALTNEFEYIGFGDPASTHFFYAKYPKGYMQNHPSLHQKVAFVSS